MQKNNLFKGEGYTLAYSEYGTTWGFPVIFNHGLIGCDYLTDALQQYALHGDLRLVSIARSGYGDSSPHPMGSISEWGALVEPLLVDLGIEGNFGTIGISAGAPYAHSLASYFGERIIGVWIISGVPFIPDKEVWRLYPEQSQAHYRRFEAMSDAELADEFSSYIQPILSEKNMDEETRIILEATRRQHYAGVIREVRLQTKEWGFSPYASACPTFFWHSENDGEVPFAPVDNMVQKMSNATLIVQKEPEHSPSEQTKKELFESIRKTCQVPFKK